MPIRQRVNMKSGHCHFPSTVNPEESHERCKRNNNGVYTSPNGDTEVMCGCSCHFPEERYECGECGGDLVEAAHVTSLDGPDEEVWLHTDENSRWVAGEFCS